MGGKKKLKRLSFSALGSSTRFALTATLLSLVSGCYGTPRTGSPDGEGGDGHGGTSGTAGMKPLGGASGSKGGVGGVSSAAGGTGGRGGGGAGGVTGPGGSSGGIGGVTGGAGAAGGASGVSGPGGGSGGISGVSGGAMGGASGVSGRGGSNDSKGGNGGVSGSGGWAGVGVSGQGGSATCAIACSSTAYCDRGTCKSRITEFNVPTQNAEVGRITAGPDGSLWFTERAARKIGRITLSGVITEFDIPSGSQPDGITAGPDGNVWFAERRGAIGRVTPNGVVTEFPTPSGADPVAITMGADENVYFTEYSNSKIGIITAAGTITEVDVPILGDLPGISRGPDGNVWFLVAGARLEVPMLGRLTPGHDLRFFQLPTPYSNPQTITTGSDGNLWFTEYLKIGRSTVNGLTKEFDRNPAGALADAITNGPDRNGNVWFSDGAGYIGQVTPAGVITESLVTGWIGGIAVGGDGNVWFTEAMPNPNRIARFLVP